VDDFVSIFVVKKLRIPPRKSKIEDLRFPDFSGGSGGIENESDFLRVQQRS